jgi:hypothetical protein
METWLYRLPRVARFAVLTTMMFGALVVVLEIESRLGILAAQSQVQRLVIAALVALAIAAFTNVLGERCLRRDFGSIEKFLVYRGALRTGKLPQGVDADAWRAWMNRSRRLNRSQLVAALMWFGIAVVNLAGQWAHHWTAFSFFAVVALYLLVLWQVERQRISRLEAALERELSRRSSSSNE